MANIITGIRIVCALALCSFSAFSRCFNIFYILGGISDVLDGIVARHFGKETKFGASFDTIADIVFTVVVIIKVVQAVEIPVWIIVWIVCIFVIKCINIICGFVLYKRFVPEHTVMNKVCGVLVFVIPLVIGVFQRNMIGILIVPACAIATISAVQEGHYICAGKGLENEV